MSPSQHTSSNGQDDRWARIEDIIMNCLQRRYRGEEVSDESIVSEHRELMPELGQQLRQLRSLSEPKNPANTRVAVARPDGTRILRIHCPHCHQSVEVSPETPLTNIICSTCGSRFSLVGDDSTTQDSTDSQQFAHFELNERLGVGSFGAVWKARDRQLDRVVAVKIPHKGQLNFEETEKFLREARAAAQLRHPNIVTVHQVGSHDDTVYIVSDLIHGVSLADWLAHRHASAREAAQLCADVAEALHHAHDNGVIHRDLKPQNIMLDADRQPHIMDFGLARREAGEVTMTMEGHVVGTPAYMSPEQARGESHQADRHSDIYSVGVILFELLTGELPFRGNARMLIQQVVHDPAPSPRKLNQSVPRELATICLKCLEKEPTKRYGTGRELAEELRRYLRGEPILARPVSALARTWRWCKRKPAIASLTASLAVLLLFLAVAGPIVAISQTQARRIADEQAEHNRRLLYVSDMNAAVQSWDASNIRRTLRLLNRHRPDPGQADFRGFEWYWLWRLCYMSLTSPSIKHTEAVASVVFSPDGEMVASGSGKSVRLWNAGTRKLERTFEGHRGDVSCVAFSPDGNILASGSADKTVILRATDSGKLLHTLEGHQQAITSLAFSREGTTLATSGGNPRDKVRLWDVPTGKLLDFFEVPAPRGAPRAQHAWSVAISPDDKTLVTADYGGGVTFWDSQTRIQLCTLREAHSGHANCVAFSPDGQTVATGGNDSTLRLWDVATYTKLADLRGHSGPVMSVVFSHDGKTLATSSVDSTVRLWNVASKEQIRTFNGHTAGVTSVAFSPDSSSLASGGQDNKLKLWDTTGKSEPTSLTGHPFFVADLTLAPNNILASISYARDLRLWDITSGSSESFPESLMAVDFSPNGESLALVAINGDVKIWDVDLRQEVQTLMGAKAIAAVFSPNGRILATGSTADDKVTLRDTQTWQAVASVDDFGGWTGSNSLAFSPDGISLAIPCSDYTITLWDVTSHQHRVTLEGHVDRIACVAYSRDGKTLASGSWDGTVIVWDITSYKFHKLRGHMEKVFSVAFSPDGKTLASGGTEGIILWNLATMEQVSRLKGHAGIVKCMAFSPDERMLISGSFDTTIKLWQTATEEDVLAADSLDRLELPQTHVKNY